LEIFVYYKMKCGKWDIRGYVGADGEALDCYIYSGLLEEKPTGSNRLFQITQVSPEDGDFDEHKFMLGYENLKAAKLAYLQEMPVDFFGGIQEVAVGSLELYENASKNIQTVGASMVGLGDVRLAMPAIAVSSPESPV
jgi:Inorganic Pyrophosphatase